jgi:uncharacterized protein DUF5977
MAIAPCSGAVNCEGTDGATANLSAEDADVFKCFRYAFGPLAGTVCEFPISICNAFADIGADVGILCAPLIPSPNPPPPIIYSSSAQSCTVQCGPGDFETYTAVVGTFVGLSQAIADAKAKAFACEVATVLCTGTPTIYTNTAQSCTVTCPNGAAVSYTTPTAFFSALSQADADFEAFLFACDVAALLCSGPPLPLTGGAGVPPPIPNTPLYSNFAQSCSSTCEDGSVYVYTIPGGTYLRESRAAANAIAISAACRLAQLNRACLSSLPATICVGEFFSEFLST